MKILILGAGQVGRTAASHLSREEANEVTVVDVNEDALRDLQERLEVRTVVGNAAHPTVLEAAGAGEADVMVALTSSDEVNMMACEVAFVLFRTPDAVRLRKTLHDKGIAVRRCDTFVGLDERYLRAAVRSEWPQLAQAISEVTGHPGGRR